MRWYTKLTRARSFDLTYVPQYKGPLDFLLFCTVVRSHLRVASALRQQFCTIHTCQSVPACKTNHFRWAEGGAATVICNGFAVL